MDKDSKQLRIFIASPGDVVSERDCLHTVIRELTKFGNIASFLGFTLDILDWRDITPSAGRPEDVVLEQLPVEAWDIFIGILWLRFGTQTGKPDPYTGEMFASGTEEEFRLAYEAWGKHNHPKILFYRCMRAPANLAQIDPDQYKRVQVFFEQFDVDARHPGLYQSFHSIQDFERRVRQDLTKLLIERFYSVIEDRFGLKIPRNQDVLKQLAVAWEVQALFIKLIESVFSESAAGQVQWHALLESLTKLLGNPQTILVRCSPGSAPLSMITTVNVPSPSYEFDWNSGLLARLIQSETDYIAFTVEDCPTQDPFYHVFAAGRTIETFPVWRSGQCIGFVAFASTHPLIDQTQIRLVKTAVRLLVSLP